MHVTFKPGTIRCVVKMFHSQSTLIVLHSPLPHPQPPQPPPPTCLKSGAYINVYMQLTMCVIALYSIATCYEASDLNKVNTRDMPPSPDIPTGSTEPYVV